MIILIADVTDTHKNESLLSKKLEFVEKEYFNDVYAGLQEIDSVIIYDNIESFLDNISKHTNDIVFSIWSGTESKNRRALVPSICESYKIKYVGADTYTNILSQDKSLAKEYCSRFGLKTPQYLLYNGINNIETITNLKLPVLVKPNFEGGSIGISKKNILFSYSEAINYSKMLFDHFGEVLIEEFIEGKEICFVLSGNKDKVNIIQGVEIYNPNDPTFFDREIFGYEVKKHSEISLMQKGFTPKNHEILYQKFKNIFISLGKVEALRIDGKFLNGDFYMLELSPDIHFGKTASFAIAHSCQGINYNNMLKSLIENASSK